MADRIIRDWQGVTTEELPPDDVNVRLDRLSDAVLELVTLLSASDATVPEQSKPTYSFKVAPELLWAAGTTAGTVLLQALTDVEKITDYKVWAVGLGAALIRALIGAALSQSKPKTEATP